MKKWGYFWTTVCILTLAAWALTLTGCHAQPAEWSELGEKNQPQAQEQDPQQEQERPRPQNTKGLHVVPVSRRGNAVIELRADDVIRILRGMGCSDEQILEIGRDLHDALAGTGAAQIMFGKKVEANMQTGGENQVLISSANRGVFIYDLRRRQLGLPNGAPSIATQR
jgi:hypothetical protein